MKHGNLSRTLVHFIALMVVMPLHSVVLAAECAGGSITISALGRPLHLGRLLNLQTDTVASGSLWDQDDINVHTIRWKAPSEKTETLVRDTFRDKTHVFDMEVELKMSFLGGLVEVSGGAKFLDDHKKSSHQTRVSLPSRNRHLSWCT